jgi:hypothetical protein
MVLKQKILHHFFAFGCGHRQRRVSLRLIFMAVPHDASASPWDELK